MKKLFVLLGIMLCLAAPAWAATSHKIVVETKGLVCDFCAQAVKKVFLKQPEVADIDVNLDSKKVTITLKDAATMDDARVTKLITDSGYNVASIHRE